MKLNRLLLLLLLFFIVYFYLNPSLCRHRLVIFYYRSTGREKRERERENCVVKQHIDT